MKALFITILALLSLNINASIVCHTPRSNKVFEIKNTKVTFFNESDKSAKRELASVISRSRSTESGITKIVDFENQKHTIHIGDESHFSDAEDYIIIQAKSGHEVTYPLSCEQK
ncbi:MAG: hypothetical protein Q7U04_10730 [Bacteriovorax sp.]|nr:hypothetical protein [Bacteriovorax sp.]